MSEEERIRRAEIIAERRQNIVYENNTNSKEKKKMSFGSKISIQIIVSICIFGVFYFLTDNYSMAIEKIKPIMSADTNFEELYWNINGAIKNITNKHENNFNNEEQKQEESKNENTANVTNTTETPHNEQENNQVNGIGGGDENIKESKTEDDVTYIKTHANLSKPVQGIITSPYGPRTPTEIISANHAGVDIGVEEGTPILSAMDGVVELVSSEGGYGNHVKITNGEISTIYAHCSKITVQKGTYVHKGDKIAEAGSTGNATGPHLHFEIRRNDVTVNPQEVLEL